MCISIYGISFIKLLIKFYFHIFVFLLIMCLQPEMYAGGIRITEKTIFLNFSSMLTYNARR